MNDVVLPDFKSVPSINLKIRIPVNHDGTDAERIDKFANFNNRGGFIRWSELSSDGNDIIWRYAKILRIKKKVKSIDYDVMNRELSSLKKYDIDNVKFRKRMESRICRVFSKMGLSHTEALSTTILTKEISTILSGTDRYGKEYIAVNPYLLHGRLTWLNYAFKRSYIERGILRGRDSFDNDNLLRLTACICANRLMGATPTGRISSGWQNFCRYFYSQESKETILALCNASLDQKDLDQLGNVNPSYLLLWNELYQVRDEFEDYVTKKGKKKRRIIKDVLPSTFININPNDLYFRLKNIISKTDMECIKSVNDGGMNPFGILDKEIVGPSKRIITLGGEVLPIAARESRKCEIGIRKALISRKLSYSINWHKHKNINTIFWDKYMLTPDDIEDPKLNKRVRKLCTQKILRDVVGKITEVYQHDVITRPFAQKLTEEGLLLASLGMRPPKFPFLWNIDGTEGKRRAAVFFDLSSNMTHFFGHMMYMCDAMEEFLDVSFARNSVNDDQNMHVFDQPIKELSNDDIVKMKGGDIVEGVTTNFDELVNYCVDTIHTYDIDLMITFTDGQSRVSDKNVKKFNKCGKRMYTIYMTEPTRENKDIKIVSGLDSLIGESFTVRVPKTDIIKEI